jgi:hypothetical protein
MAKKRSEEYKQVKRRSDRAKRELKTALEDIKEVPFSWRDEEVEILNRDLDAIDGLLSLTRSALAGETGVDFDAELNRIEERLEWGPDGKPDDYIEEP